MHVTNHEVDSAALSLLFIEGEELLQQCKSELAKLIKGSPEHTQLFDKIQSGEKTIQDMRIDMEFLEKEEADACTFLDELRNHSAEPPKSKKRRCALLSCLNKIIRIFSSR